MHPPASPHTTVRNSAPLAGASAFGSAATPEAATRFRPRGVIFRPRDIVFRPRRQVNELLSGLDRYDGDGEICVGLASEWMIRNDPGFVYNPDDMLFQVPFAPPFPP